MTMFSNYHELNQLKTLRKKSLTKVYNESACLSIAMGFWLVMRDTDLSPRKHIYVAVMHRWTEALSISLVESI